jgi:hypothetical protein
VFVDRTVSRDPDANIICASVSSLSPFVVAVNTAGNVSLDSVVLPVPPIKITVPSGKDAIIKKVNIKVQNADLGETAGHQVRLAVANNTCPQSLLKDTLNQPVTPDFDPKDASVGDTILVLGGKVKTAMLPLRVVAADFTSPNAKSPARCAITFTATSIDVANVTEINASNNQTTVEINVVDKHDF